MAIRAALPGETREDGGADVQTILRHLRSLPNPPNENERGIVGLLNEPVGREFIFIHDEEDVVVRLHASRPLGPNPECVVAWWMWTGAQRVAVAQCFREALRSFVAFYPLSLTWPIWGDLPTNTEAKGLRTLMCGVAYVSVRRSPIQPLSTRAESTVGVIQARVALL